MLYTAEAGSFLSEPGVKSLQNKTDLADIGKVGHELFYCCSPAGISLAVGLSVECASITDD